MSGKRYLLPNDFKACDPCRGRGTVYCSPCNGTGRQPWYTGGVRLSCTTCHASGSRMCYPCGGTGDQRIYPPPPPPPPPPVVGGTALDEAKRKREAIALWVLVEANFPAEYKTHVVRRLDGIALDRPDARTLLDGMAAELCRRGLPYQYGMLRNDLETLSLMCGLVALQARG